MTVVGDPPVHGVITEKGLRLELLYANGNLRFDSGPPVWIQVSPEAEMTLYSQRDPRWRNAVYAGGLTFGAAGCYVTCVAMIASLAAYEDTPPQVAAKLRDVGAFAGALLAYPDRIPEAYPRLVWWEAVNWHHGPANLIRVRNELELGPIIMEVDFKPVTSVKDQHFVVAKQFDDGSDDIWIADPIDGARTRLMQRYAMNDWSLARAVYGLRLLRADTVESLPI